MPTTISQFSIIIFIFIFSLQLQLQPVITVVSSTTLNNSTFESNIIYNNKEGIHQQVQFVIPTISNEENNIKKELLDNNVNKKNKKDGNATCQLQKILFLSIPLTGHMNPLYNLALELSENNYFKNNFEFIIASTNPFINKLKKKYLKKFKTKNNISFLNLGKSKIPNYQMKEFTKEDLISRLTISDGPVNFSPANFSNYEEFNENLFRYVSQGIKEKDFDKYIKLLGLTTSIFSISMYKKLNNFINLEKNCIKLIISDFMTLIGQDMAEKYKIKSIVNQVGLIKTKEYLLSSSNIGLPINLNIMTRFYNLLFNYLQCTVIEDHIFILYKYFKSFTKLNTTNICDNFYTYKVPSFINFIYGIDLPQWNHPLVHTVGLLSKERDEEIKENEWILKDYLNKNESVFHLLDWVRDEGSLLGNLKKEVTVVFINLGTTGSLDLNQTVELLNGLKILQKEWNDYYKNLNELKVIWRLNNSFIQKELFKEKLNEEIPNFIKIIDWLPSQINLLQEENIKLFINHGGVNSVLEGLISKKILLTIPCFVDQFDISNRVEYFNFGKQIKRNDLNSTIIKTLIFDLLTNNETERMKSEIDKISKLLKKKGLKYAANLVIDILEDGYEHLIPRGHLELNHLERNNFDILKYLLIFSFIAGILVTILLNLIYKLFVKFILSLKQTTKNRTSSK
ncbi:hypothetical protein ABK040_001687 [Willaertia magna]